MDKKTSLRVKLKIRAMKKRKKIIILSIITFLLLGTCLLLMKTCFAHKHTYQTVVTKEATCTEPGVANEICSCGDVKPEAIDIPALGHSYYDGSCIRCAKIQTTFYIEKLEFVINGQALDKYSAPFYCDDFKVSLKINDGINLSDYIYPRITWGFLGDDHGCTVSRDGTVCINDFIGNLTLSVTVESENSVTCSLPIKLTMGEVGDIESLVITTNEGYTQNYVDGDIFDANSITVWGEYNGGVVRICDCTTDKTPLTEGMAEFVIKYGELVADIPIMVKHKTLQSIEIVEAPLKTEYLEDQTFERDGMVVKAVFDNSEEIITDFAVDEHTKLEIGTDSALISYTYNGVTATVRQSITVIPKKLLSISVDASAARDVYTQGDIFNPYGLVVVAEFEHFGTVEVFDYRYTTDLLTTDDTFVEIYYTAGEVTKTATVSVEVVKPYTEISVVKVLTPVDISIIWSYSYMTDGGELMIDNTAYEVNGLRYDQINGYYEIPLGAIVTATLKNPAVINVSLNGVDQAVNYTEKTVTWTMGKADLVVIKSIEMSGIHSVIRFAGQENEQSFLYEGSWNGILTADNIERLASVFADTEDYYHIYVLNGASYKLEELAETVFEPNSNITVIKNIISDNAKEIVLHLGDEISHNIRLLETAKVDELPVFTKAGFRFEGWALSPDGERITDIELESALSEQRDEYHLYIRWIKEDIDYSDMYFDPEEDDPTYESGPSDSGMIKLVGRWGVYVTVEGEEWEFYFTFYADGTFEHEVVSNGSANCYYHGYYRIANNCIVIISVDTELAIPIPSASDFSFEIEGDKLESVVVIADSTSLAFVTMLMSKLPDTV